MKLREAMQLGHSYIGSMQNGGRGELDMQWPDNG